MLHHGNYSLQTVFGPNGRCDKPPLPSVCIGLSSAAAVQGCQHYCGAGPLRPVPDQYALATDEQANEQTKMSTSPLHKAPLCGDSLILIIIIIITRGQSNLTKSASRGPIPRLGVTPRGSKFVPLNSWGRVSY